MKTKEEILKTKFASYYNFEILTANQKEIILESMKKYAKEYHSEHQIKLMDSDCNCTLDQYGASIKSKMCLIHEKR